MLYKDSKYSHLLSTELDRKNMGDLQVLHTSIESARKRVSSESKPTATLIMPIVERLLSHYLVPKDNESNFIKKAKYAMRVDLKKTLLER